MPRFTSLRPSRKLTLSLVTVFAIFAPQAAQAQIRGSLSNFDAWNFTGSTANDFEVFLGGLVPGNISSTYNGDYPNATMTNTGTGTIVRWTGSTTPDTQKAHFGVSLLGNAQPIPVSYTWTFNAQTIGQLPSSWQGWDFDGRRRDIIRNFGTSPISVQRRWAVVAGPLALGDLLRGSAIWNSATLIDTSFQTISGGSSLNFDFNIAGDDDWYVLMYDLRDSSGNLVMTSLNAAQAVPEPASAAVLGLSLALLLRRRSR